MEEKELTVLMTTDTSNEVWSYSLNLSRKLKKYGIQVHLLAMGGWPTPAQQVEAENISNVIFYKSDYKLNWMADSWEDLDLSKKWINSIYQTVKPDILHLNNYAHLEADWTAPLVIILHDNIPVWLHTVKGNNTLDEWEHYVQIIEKSVEKTEKSGVELPPKPEESTKDSLLIRNKNKHPHIMEGQTSY